MLLLSSIVDSSSVCISLCGRGEPHFLSMDEKCENILDKKTRIPLGVFDSLKAHASQKEAWAFGCLKRSFSLFQGDHSSSQGSAAAIRRFLRRISTAASAAISIGSTMATPHMEKSV